MAPQIIIKDKIEDGVELDLSLSDLQDVPVKEISLYKKIHTIDLSNNHLIKLPTTFPTLTHLIKLDLSKNKLKELPANFGDLIKLKHLDLYKNQLEHLPLSFGKLKHLRWLDLKDNPLYPAIKDVAGQCLDGKQCQKCAKDIVQFYTTLNSKVECERAIREEQRLRSRLDNERKSKEEKTNRKKKKMAQRASEEANKKVDDLRNNKTIHDGKEVNKTVDVKVTKKPNNSFRQMIASTSKCIISLVFILTLTIGLLDFYSETETAKLIKTTLHRFIPEEYLENVSLFLRNCLAKFHCLKETIKNNSMANSFFASVSNQMNVIYDGFRKKLKDYL